MSGAFQILRSHLWVEAHFPGANCNALRGSIGAWHSQGCRQQPAGQEATSNFNWPNIGLGH